MRRGLLLLACLAACANNNDSGDEDAPVDCSTQVADTFTVGLEHPGTAGLLDFHLMSADPAPPARGNNTWVVQINDLAAGSDGAPVTGAQLVVTPYMPAHGHGTPVTVEITEDATPGEYTLSPVNLWMPGVWQTTIQVAAGATMDKTIYTFCLPD